MFFYRERAGARGSQLFPVVAAIGHAQNPMREPVFEIFEAARLLVVLSEKRVIAATVALDGRWMRASRFVDDGGNKKSRNERPVGVGGNDAGFDNFFRHDN